MASAFSLPDISIEINEEESETGATENEQKSSQNPYLISTTTGGLENSCHNCMLAFGMVTLIIGVSTSSLAYATGPTDTVFFKMGMTVLSMGIASITFSCLWRYYRRKRKAKKMEDLAELFYEYQEKKIRV